MTKLIDLTLPEWAFLDGNSPLGDTLEGRTLINHIRSVSIIEVLHEDFVLKEGILFREYEYDNGLIAEKFTLVLHYSAKLDTRLDESMIVEQILNPCAEWYIKYLVWEDSNIIDSGISKLN